MRLGPMMMNPTKETGPASGTFTFSLLPRSALSGVSNDRTQNAAAPTKASMMPLICLSVSFDRLADRLGRQLAETAATAACAGRLRQELKLTRFRGHRTISFKEFHDGQDKIALCT